VRILFDQGTPVPLRRLLNSHAIKTAFELEWSTLENGQLIASAESEHTTAKPGEHLLVSHDLGVGVARPDKGHDEQPGGDDLAGAGVNNVGTFAEVDLRGFTGVELENRCHPRMKNDSLCLG
jgi:hypothetical protein